jgi:hypothetical protein
MVTSLAAALVAALLFFAPPRGDEPARLVDIDPAAVVGLTVAPPGDVPVTLNKTAVGWRIVAPVAAPADEEVVTALIATAALLPTMERFADVDPVPYGLDDPVRIGFTLADGKVVTITLGDMNPGKTGRYAAVDGREVALVPLRQGDGLVKHLFELRDRRLVVVDPLAVTGVRIERPTAIVAVELTDGVWRTPLPDTAAVDTAAATELVGLLVNLTGAGFYETVTPAMGFDAPSAVATLTVADGTTTVRFGAPTGGGGRYVTVGDIVARIDEELFDRLPVAPDDLRDLTWLPAARSTVDRLVILREGETITLVADEPSGETWRMTTPTAEGADPNRVTALIHRLGYGRAARAIAPSADGGEVATVSVATADGDLARLVIGKGETGYYALRPDGAALAVSAEEVDLLAPPATALIDRRLFRFGSAPVARIVVERLGQTFDLVRDDAGIRLVSPESGPVKPGTFNRFLWSLLGVVGDRVYAGAVGKTKNDIVMTMFDEGGATLGRATLRRVADEPGAPWVGMVDGRPPVIIDARFPADVLVAGLASLLEE